MLTTPVYKRGSDGQRFVKSSQIVKDALDTTTIPGVNLTQLLFIS